MKKIGLLLMVFLLSFSLLACNQQGGKSSSDDLKKEEDKQASKDDGTKVDEKKLTDEKSKTEGDHKAGEKDKTEGEKQSDKKEEANKSGDNSKVEQTQADKNKQTNENETENQKDPLIFESQADIKSFLVGEWIYYDQASYADMAWIAIKEDGSYEFKIIDPVERLEYKTMGNLKFLDYTEDEQGLANAFSFETTKLEAPEKYKDRYFGGQFDGDYSLTYKTLGDGEIIIELYQISNGNTLMFEHFGSPRHVFRKVSDLDQRTEMKKNSEFYAICAKEDYDRKLVWLDEVSYDPVSKKLTYGDELEALAYKKSDLEKISADQTVNYTFALYHVKTDDNGEVVLFEQIEHDNYPFKE